MAKIKKIKLPPLKAICKAVVKYREERAAGRIGKISALEDISSFFGKKGQVLKRETRYNTQRTRLIEGVKEVQKQLGKTPGKETFKRITEKRTQATQKAAETFAKKNIKKTKSGAADKRFKKQAKEKANQFMNAVDVFASDTYNALIDGAYGIGSDVVISMAERGLEPDEIEEYLKQVKETWDDIPEEARGLATRDDFWNAVTEITETMQGSDSVDFKDVLQAYITTTPDMEDFKAALGNYIEYGDSSKPFTAVWDELKDSLDPASYDNLTEIMESEVD